MKEAFGGTFVLKLIMLFFVIYITLIGITLQIAKAYRVKNGVINLLEQKQYDNINEEPVFLKNYLDSIPYKVPVSQAEGLSKNCENRDGKYYYDVCLIQDPNGGSSYGHYYKVIVYFVIEFPFFDNYVLPFTASGETMTIKSYNK